MKSSRLSCILVLIWPLSSNSRYKSKNDEDDAVSLTSSSGGYINGRNSANLELLIDKTSSIYLFVKLKALTSWIFLFFTSFWRNSDSYEYKINRLEEGHNSYPLVCRRPAETVSLQRRQMCYRWGTLAYWSLVPRSSMFYLFEFCLKCCSSKFSHIWNLWVVIIHVDWHPWINYHLGVPCLNPGFSFRFIICVIGIS